jgi:hypothetical protein
MAESPPTRKGRAPHQKPDPGTNLNTPSVARLIDWTTCAYCGKKADKPDGWAVSMEGRPGCWDCIRRVVERLRWSR